MNVIGKSDNLISVLEDLCILDWNKDFVIYEMSLVDISFLMGGRNIIHKILIGLNLMFVCVCLLQITIVYLGTFPLWWELTFLIF